MIKKRTIIISNDTGMTKIYEVFQVPFLSGNIIYSYVFNKNESANHERSLWVPPKK